MKMKNQFGVEFTDKLRALRIERKIKQKDLAEMLHCQRSVYSALECGKMSLNSYVNRLIDIFGEELVEYIPNYKMYTNQKILNYIFLSGDHATNVSTVIGMKRSRLYETFFEEERYLLGKR